MKNKIIILVSILLLVIAAAGIGQRLGYWDLKKLKGQSLPSYTVYPHISIPTATLPDYKGTPAPSSATADLPKYPAIPLQFSVVPLPSTATNKSGPCSYELTEAANAFYKEQAIVESDKLDSIKHAYPLQERGQAIAKYEKEKNKYVNNTNKNEWTSDPEEKERRKVAIEQQWENAKREFQDKIAELNAEEEASKKRAEKYYAEKIEKLKTDVVKKALTLGCGNAPARPVSSTR